MSVFCLAPEGLPGWPPTDFSSLTMCSAPFARLVMVVLARHRRGVRLAPRHLEDAHLRLGDVLAVVVHPGERVVAVLCPLSSSTPAGFCALPSWWRLEYRTSGNPSTLFLRRIALDRILPDLERLRGSPLLRRRRRRAYPPSRCTGLRATKNSCLRRRRCRRSQHVGAPFKRAVTVI